LRTERATWCNARTVNSGRGPRKEIAMKILVTGATGTVGSEVVKALLQRGAEVRALTRKRPEPVKLSDAVEITWGDLSDPVSVQQFPAAPKRPKNGGGSAGVFALC